MNGQAAWRRISVSSIFHYVEKICCESAPKSGKALLGGRWSFALPFDRVETDFCEYSLPLGISPYTELLRKRTGVTIEKHHGFRNLLKYLAGGGTAIVVVNSYHLPYRPAYGRVHSNRTMLVRHSELSGYISVEDDWAPAYHGLLEVTHLNNAMHCDALLKPELEPVFVGQKIDGEWYRVELQRLKVNDPAEFAISLLQDIYYEATKRQQDENGSYGIDEIRRFLIQLERELVSEPDLRFDRLRTASLLIRSELSSRVYFAELLSVAAGWTGIKELRTLAYRYLNGLRAMELGRDLLIKTMAHPSAAYDRVALTQLKKSAENELRMAESLRFLLAL